jgi:hypothetical protein
MTRPKLRIGIALAVVLVLAGAGGAAFATTYGQAGPNKGTFLAGDTVAHTTTSAPWVDLSGAKLWHLAVSPGGDTLVARFSAESACYPTVAGSTTHGYCSVRIVAVDEFTGTTTVMTPAANTDFAFDSTNGGTETSSSWESHSFERFARLSPDEYTVKVQWGIAGLNATNTSFRLDDWTLTVEEAD